MPQMRIPVSQISSYTSRYPRHLDAQLLALAPSVKSRGYLRPDELMLVGKWKSPRSAGRLTKNTDSEVSEITSISLAASCERVRIESLQVLHGVNYPTASVVLHFFHSEQYPIIDFRAIWTLGLMQPKAYNFEYWWTFVTAWRNEFESARVSLLSLTPREFDQALWQYSKENQPTVGC